MSDETAPFTVNSAELSGIEKLVETMARLRSPTGCPWDQKQTHQSLAICLTEETAELLDTIDREDYEHMLEELGDVLLQVVFHAQLTAEAGRFTFDDVAHAINDKLLRRHPHVFGDVTVENADQSLVEWEKVKAAEKPKAGDLKEGRVFKRIPPQLPALLFAHDVAKQAFRAGEPVGDDTTMAAIHQLGETLTAESAGKALFEIASACKLADIDPESALRRYSRSVIQTIEDDS